MSIRTSNSKKSQYAVDWIVVVFLVLIALASISLVLEMFLSLAFIRDDVALFGRIFRWVELCIAFCSFLVIYSAIGKGKFFPELYIGYSIVICVLLLLNYFIQSHLDLQKFLGLYEFFSIASILGVPYVFRNNSLFIQIESFSSDHQKAKLDLAKYKYLERSVEPKAGIIEHPSNHDSTEKLTETSETKVNKGSMYSTRSNNTVSELEEIEPAIIVDNRNIENATDATDLPYNDISRRITNLRRMAGLSSSDIVDNNVDIGGVGLTFELKRKHENVPNLGPGNSNYKKEFSESMQTQKNIPSGGDDNKATDMSGANSTKNITNLKEDVDFGMEDKLAIGKKTVPDGMLSEDPEDAAIKFHTEKSDGKIMLISKRESLDLLESLGLIKSGSMDS